jgi:hypothetical protein
MFAGFASCGGLQGSFLASQTQGGSLAVLKIVLIFALFLFMPFRCLTLKSGLN